MKVLCKSGSPLDGVASEVPARGSRRSVYTSLLGPQSVITGGPADAVAGLKSPTADSLLALLQQTIDGGTTVLADHLERGESKPAEVACHSLLGTSKNGRLWRLAKVIEEIEIRLHANGSREAACFVPELREAAVEAADLIAVARSGLS